MSKQLSRREFLKAALTSAAGLSMGAPLLAACAQEEVTPTQVSQAATKETAAEQATVTYWKSPHSEFAAERWAKIISDFEAINPNIKIEHTIVPWENLDESYTAAVAGGNPPDVAYLPDQFYLKFADSGALADLGQWVDDPSYASEKKAWYENAWQTGNFQGTQVGIPNVGVGQIIYYNKTLFEKAGLTPPPKTWDELIEFGKALTVPDDVWGYAGNLTFREQGYCWNLQWFYDEGADVLNEDWTAPGFDNPGGLKALTFITDMICKHKIHPPLGAYNEQGITALFTSGKLGMLYGQQAYHGTFKISDLGFDYDWFMPPGGSVKQVTFGNYGFYCMAQASKVKDAAWKWIEYISSAAVDGPFAEQHGFSCVRKDVDIYKDDPIGARIQRDMVPNMQGFQMHPAIRELLGAMWSEFEAAFACTTTPEEALQKAADAVSNVLKG